VAFEAYSVAVRLKLVDDVTGGLLGIAGHFKILEGTIGKTKAEILALEASWKKIKTTALIGGAMMGTGGAMLLGMKAPLEEAKAWAQESAKFASLGFGAKVNADAQKFALGMQTYGTSARENLTLVSDAMAVFKDLGHAEMAAPIMAKMKFANEAVFGKETGGANEGKFMDLLKVIEFRGGLSSNAAFSAQANFAQQVIAGSRGRVDASALLQALKTGGVSLSRLSNEAFYLNSEPLIQEFGGQRFGTGNMSIYQNLVQSRGTITAQQELYRLGLLDKSKVEFNDQGALKKALPGAFVGSNIFETEGLMPLLQKVLLPAFAKAGITGDEAIIRELGMILGNRTGSNLATRAYQQRDTIAIQSAANAHAQNIDQLSATGANTPEGKMIQLSAQWKNVLRELGMSVLPIAIKGVQGLTSIVKGILSFTREFPNLTKVLVVAFTTLGALMLAGGAVTMIAAGLGGLALIPGIATLGGVLLTAAGGLGAIAVPLLALAAAGAGGYAIGAWINKKFNLSEKIGGLFSDSYDPNKGFEPGKYVYHGKGGAGTTIHTQINMDGRKVADAVSTHQLDAFKPVGGEAFDPSMTLPSVGMNGVY
jgi:hypothetical protein